MNMKLKNAVFELEPQEINEVRKLYNLFEAERREEAIRLLESWIAKQDHFVNKEYSKEYLERMIISCKGSVERAKHQIERLCTLRTLVPSFFDAAIKNELSSLKEAGHIVLLPKLTKNLYRIALMNAVKRPENFSLMYVFRYIIAILEFIKAHDYCSGMIIILDYTNFNLLELLQCINISELRQFIIIAMEGYGVRIKGIHIITSSTLAETYIKILKQVMKKKVADRIILHKTRQTLFEYVPKNLLPVEYGGDESSIEILNDKLRSTLKSKEHAEYLQTLQGYQTTEKYKSELKCDEEYLGISGTFRTLSID